MKIKAIYAIPAVLGLIALLLVGGAFAADNSNSVAFVQASQLQLNIDKAVTVGTTAIAQIQANGSDTTNLTTTLNALIALDATIDPNTSTVDQVQSIRQQAESLVTSFRTQAQALLSASQRQQIKTDAEAKFEAQYQQRQTAVQDLREAFNMRNLDAFAQAQQRLVLGLNTSDNVSVVPELSAKLSDIRTQIMDDMVTKDQIGQIRTQIKAETQSLAVNKSETVADIRVAQLQQRVQAFEIVIAKATAANISTDNLQTTHDSLVALLGSYASGNITAADFSTQAQASLEASTKVIMDPSLASIRMDVMKSLMPMRVMLQNETKQDLQQWQMQRGQIISDIKTMHGNVSDLRIEMRQNMTTARGDLRTAISTVRRDGPGMGGLHPVNGGNGSDRRSGPGPMPQTSVGADADTHTQTSASAGNSNTDASANAGVGVSATI